MLNNKTFYPTPQNLISKMISKIQGKPKLALEPSAGKGDIIEAFEKSYKFSQWHNKPEFSAIEINTDLQATLRGKKIKLIDTDFLAYSGSDKFDLIIMNPPFDDGDKHLHKALDIMYRGEIVCLLNAETLRNPHTNNRRLLVQRLDEHGASIEYIQNAFVTAERRTAVEVALIYIKIDRNVEDDLFTDCNETSYQAKATIADNYEVSTGMTIFELVADYNNVIQTAQETIMAYFKNYRKVGAYLSLINGGNKESSITGDLTEKMQKALNTLLIDVRKTYWRKTLDLKEVRSRMTQKKTKEFEEALTDRCHMDFTEENIRQFVLNLIGGYEQTLIEAVIDLFDRFTIRHTYDDNNRHEKNIHYFNGWKTNKAFKVGRRVIIPVRASYGEPFTNWGKWELDYQARESLRDIDLVMSYFDGMKDHISISDALTASFANQENATTSTYFKITAHKKGTIHLTFLNEDILRRFNVVACRGKNWLPGDFGSKPYSQLGYEMQTIIDSFEDAKTYDKNVNVPLFAVSATSMPCIEFQEAA